MQKYNYITQNHCQPILDHIDDLGQITRVYMPYNTYVNGRGGLNLS